MLKRLVTSGSSDPRSAANVCIGGESEVIGGLHPAGCNQWSLPEPVKLFCQVVSIGQAWLSNLSSLVHAQTFGHFRQQ